MIGDPLALILLPTYRCNARCDYCFENTKEGNLSLERLSVLIDRVLDHMDESAISELDIHWQGGEMMTLPVEWFNRAHEIIRERAEKRKRRVNNHIQSNMIGYSRQWHPVLKEMFGNSVGTSIDFPNLHRRVPAGGVADYDRILLRNIQKAREDDILLGVIAVPNEESFRMGARQFYHCYTQELSITDFQVNTPFPGGVSSRSKKRYPLPTDDLTRFSIRPSSATWRPCHQHLPCSGPARRGDGISPHTPAIFDSLND